MLLTPQRTPSSTPTSLTEAERTVAALVLQSLSNEEIAAMRGTSVRTVANQLQSLFRKLKIGSRLELRNALEGTGHVRDEGPARETKRARR